MFHRILVGWDCSPGAVAALRAAAAIAIPSGDNARVVALAVLRPVSTESSEEGAADMAGRRDFAQDTFGMARDGLDDRSRAWVTLRFAESTDPARAICQYADEHAFDLVVLGKHGTGGLLHRRLGRIAETVAKSSRMPVLLTGNQS